MDNNVDKGAQKNPEELEKEKEAENAAVQKRMEELRIEKEESLARTAAAEEKLRKLNEKIKQAEEKIKQSKKQIKKIQKEKNIKNETDLTREDLSAAELMAILKKQPKKFKK